MRDYTPWPTIVELKRDQPLKVTRITPRGSLQRTFRLIEVRHVTQPDFGLSQGRPPETIRRIEAVAQIDGEQVDLAAEPYMMPRHIAGMRIAIEATPRIATDCDNATLPAVEGDLRLSVVAHDETWGPAELRFPIQHYRWRAATYMNTWGSRCPGPKVYYHRGEDFGAIPDQLPFIAPIDGEVSQSPLPRGDGRSNTLRIRDQHGIEFALAHMNIEQIDPRLLVGARVRAGETIGRTGATWLGKPQQWADPHLHTSLHDALTTRSGYATLIEAYLRDYPDPVLPIAGGCYQAIIDKPVILDARHTIARPPHTITEYRWKLHDGSEHLGQSVQLTEPTPGFYTEQLEVTLEDGSRDIDFAHLRVFDPARGQEQPAFTGWLYTSPHRGIRPGSEVHFFPRLWGECDVQLTFGDDSPPVNAPPLDRHLTHTYDKPGLYVAAIRGRTNHGLPLDLRARIIIESP